MNMEEHNQLVINNLGLEIANQSVVIADLRAQLETVNSEKKNLEDENRVLKNELDLYRNAKEEIVIPDEEDK